MADDSSPDTGSAPERGLGSGPHYAGPALAFERFYELIETQGIPFGDADPDELLNLVRPFLVNPERHERHVRAIVDAAWAAQTTRTFAPLLPGRRLIRRWFRKIAKPQVERLLRKYAGMREELLREVEPADLSFAMLPARRLPAAPEWEANQRIWLLQAKIAIHPTAGFEPDSLSLRLELDKDAQLVAQLPTSEMAELGVHEVQLSNQGQFRVATTDSAKLGGELGAAPAKLTSELSTSQERELTISASGSHKVTYNAKVANVIASAVGNVARWEMLGASGQKPVGGLDFYLTVLLPATASRVSVAATAQVAFSAWGPLRLEYGETLKLTSALPPAAGIGHDARLDG